MLKRNPRFIAQAAGLLMVGGVLCMLFACGSAPETDELELRANAETRASLEEEDRLLIERARRLLAGEKADEVIGLLNGWLEREATRKSPWRPEALYLRGNAKLALGDEFESLYDYEEIAREYPGSEVFPLALEKELDVALMYLGGMRKKTLGLRIDSGVPVAEEIILRINERMPGSRLAERALLELADFYYRTRDLLMAAETYDVFLEAFPRSPRRSLALQRRAFANIARFKGPRYDVSGLIEARYQIEQFQREFPVDAERLGMSDALQSRLDESAAEQLLETARWYLSMGDEPACRFTLTRLLYSYPTTGAARDALRIFADRGWALPGATGTMK
jgi:outer membrane protein assembly factor BamD (BamD/ComL family)